MKITLEFSTGQEMDCRLLEGAMTAMSRCLVNHLVSEERKDAEDANEAKAKDDEEPAEPQNATPKPRARKARKVAAKEPEGETKKPENNAESNLSATSTAEHDGQDEAMPEDKDNGHTPAEQTQSDLPFDNEPEDPQPAEPKPAEPQEVKTVTTMTAQDFRQALDKLRKALGVERDTPESTLLAREISARCNTLYGTAKPSTLPGDKLARFVIQEMSDITWDEDHKGFTSKVPF